MADFRALTIQSGTVTQIQDANQIIAGAGVTTATGNLSLSAAGTDVKIASGKNLSTVAGGGGAIDFSGSTGIFKTSTGAVTVGPGAISVSGNMTMQAATLLSATGTGNISLPNNAGARFQIEGASVGATVTASNLNTLTNGSNADALHTHSGLSSSQIVITGLTTTGLADGDFGYMSAANTVSKTDNAAATTSRMFGANEGTVGSMTVAGVIENAKFTTAGGSPAVGAPVYLAAAADDVGAGAGKLTATPPVLGTVAKVGLCMDPANYAALKTVKVLLQPDSVVVL